MNEIRLFKWILKSGSLCWIMVFWVGLMIMSPIGSIFFTYNQRYFFELPLMVFLGGAFFAYPNKVRYIIRRVFTVKLCCLLFAIVLFSVIGLVRHNDLIASYADCRALFVFIAAFVILEEIGAVETDDALMFILSSSLLAGASTVVYYRLGLFNEDFGKVSLQFFAAAVAMTVSMWYRMYLFAGLGFGIAAYLSIQSGFRITMLVTVLTLVAVVLMVLAGVGSRVLRNSGFMALLKSLAVIIVLGLPALILMRGRLNSYVEAQLDSGKRYDEVVGKTTNLLNFADGVEQVNLSDMQRMDYYLDVLKYPLSYVVPKGLGSRVSEEVSSARFTLGFIGTGDSAFYFIIYHFGILSFFIISAIVLRDIFRVMRGIRLPEIFVSIAFCLPLIAYMAATSEMFTVISKIIPFVYAVFFVRVVMRKRGSSFY
jgi:hypothetical protein